MPAYSFQKRFVPRVVAGLEPGRWLPGMKRHTLRKPRTGRQGHARPEQPVHLYTAMRTKSCRKLGLAIACVQIPVRLWVGTDFGPLALERYEGAAPRSQTAMLAPIVSHLLCLPPGAFLCGEDMERFARADGFESAAEMRSFFEAPETGTAALELVLIGWRPRGEEA